MIKYLFGYSLTVVIAFVSLVFISDALEFHDIQSSTYKTPWYDISIFNPYTNLILMTSGNKKEYWTYNAIRTQRWYVREVSYKDKQYWTILERMQVQD